MKKRTLTVHRISEEQLKGLMHVAQGLSMREIKYPIMVEDIDWLIVLHVLFEQEVIHRGQRPPYKAFEKWIRQHVTLYQAAPNAQHLSVAARRLADAQHPWLSTKAPKYAVRKWQTLYHYLTQLINRAILLSN